MEYSVRSYPYNGLPDTTSRLATQPHYTIIGHPLLTKKGEAA
jgi:hypothetical protein